ncbi:hypothetical protein [Clostridium estertheticum]|uniref:hypothetical protein n=1 Tax=Clostridium estertheticum TaxID=238834 RepID=UPI001C0AFF8F|nr:hypothetical protein [Clostridium estertheticum]MBU3173272.1 hypothetical protein [Clostridium estertheticum]
MDKEVKEVKTVETGIFSGVNQNGVTVLLQPYEKSRNFNRTILGTPGGGMSFNFKTATIQGKIRSYPTPIEINQAMESMDSFGIGEAKEGKDMLEFFNLK